MKADALMLELPGRPMAKRRPRVTRAGGVYTPSSAAQDAVAMQLLGSRGLYREGPVAVSCWLYYHGVQPDVDNCIKLVLDALQEKGGAGVITDDKQVVELHAYLRKCMRPSEQCTKLLVKRPDWGNTDRQEE